METRHTTDTTDTTNASDTNQTMHGLDTESEQEPKLLRWPKPAGALQEFPEVAVELIAPEKHANRGTINTVPRAIAYVANILAASCVERAAIIMINADCRPTGYSIVGVGCGLSCRVSPAEIARVCLLSGTIQLILMHNHPACTDPEPSSGDDATIQGLYEILRQIGLVLVDFVVVGTDAKFFSYRENRRTPFAFVPTYTGWEHDDTKEKDPEEDEDYDGPDDGQN